MRLSAPILLLCTFIGLQSCGSSLHLSSGSLPINEKENNSITSKWVTKKTKTYTKQPITTKPQTTHIAHKTTPSHTSIKKEPTKWTASHKPTEAPQTNITTSTSTESIPIVQTSVSHYAVSGKASHIVANAQTYLNTPYRMGGTSYSGIDCSGLMMQSFKTQGVNLPRTADAQATVGKSLSLAEVQPGDLLFFYSSKPGVVGHSGLVVSVENGEITFIHAALSGVRYDNMSSPHWKKHYISAKRVIL